MAERSERWPELADSTRVRVNGGVADLMVYKDSVMIDAPPRDPYEPEDHCVWVNGAEDLRALIAELQWALGRLEGRDGAAVPVVVADLAPGDRFADSGRVWTVSYRGAGRLEARDSQFSSIRTYYDPISAGKAGEFSLGRQVERLPGGTDG